MSTKIRRQDRISVSARQLAAILVIGLIVMFTLATYRALAQGNGNQDYTVRLKSREFVPAPGVDPAVERQQQTASPGEQIHVIVQFWQIPSDAERATLENAGVELLAYVPANTWFASTPAGLSLQSNTLAGIRWVGAIQPEDRMAPTLQAGGIGPHAIHDDGTVRLDVRFFADITNAEVTQLVARYNGVIEAKAPDFHRFTVRVAPEAIDALAYEDGVQWITDAAPPKTNNNDGSRSRTNVDVLHSAPYNLSGGGVDLGIWDGGKVDNHVDFSGRLTVVDTSASVSDHATHVAGTMAGDGGNSASQGGTPFQWKGMAPGADIISYYWNNNLTDHNSAINTHGIELSQNSWGYIVSGGFGNCYLYGNYDYDAPDYDDIVTGLYGKRISVIFAAGNERDDGDCGMSSTPPYINYANVGPPGTAKNIIAVGATNSNDDSMTGFSSWGPVDDGRIKPDVVAPGCESTGESYIHSTFPGNTYGGPGWCGTSMAAPAVSGISGLIIEQYRATFGGADPLPSTVKALLIQTAVDLDDGTTYYNPGPDYVSGYGRVDGQAAVDEVIAQRIREDQVSNSQTDIFTINVPPGTPSLKVTLAWDDEPGAVNANPALVNNLDLVLVEPNGTTTHLPWVLNPANPSNNATTGTDSVNNVEQVQVNNPAAGTWEVRVIGTSVPVGPQQYSLAGQTFTTSGSGNVGPLAYDAHVVDDDNTNNSSGNNDGIVNPGETIELHVDLLNTGTDEATDVYATISTSSPYVTFLYNTSSGYGNMPGGGVATNTNDFDFEVNGNTPNGHVIHFDLNITASNGGPWSDSFDVTVVGGVGGGNVALISDQSELQTITSILDDMGLTYDVMNNNWDGAQGIYTSDYSFLSNYGVVVWYASGGSWGRLITQQEHDALEQFLQTGKRLLVTGYDTLGDPSDSLLADLVRSSNYGDGPFTYDYTVADGAHPIMDGAFGSFPTGTALMAGHADHDQAEADTARGAVTVAELSGGFDKLIATELASTGKVVYWNGNRNARDWVGQTTTIALAEPEPKRDAGGQTPPTNEELAAQAERLDLATIPPEANYDGDGPALRLDTAAIPAPQADIVPLASQSVTFIATGDTVSVLYDPYWWNAGDYAEGTRTLSLDSVEHLDYTLYISENVLSGTGHVDLQISINGQVVGSFTVLPGELVKNVSFDFPAIAGPTYVIRLEETNTVASGLGSITLPPDLSTMVLSSSQPDILKNTLHWLVQGAPGGGDPHEPNDTPVDCTPIFFNVPITDPTIAPAGDYDYYCFTGSSGQSIAADVDAWMFGSLLDPVLTLFDSDGTTILAENDDYGSLDSYLEYQLPHNGTFYLRVRSFGHPCCGGPGYTYSILLTDITQVIAPWSDDMESGINGWAADGFWHQVEDGVSSYPNSHSPSHSWWYGQDATGDYDNGATNAGSLTSPAINIPGSASGASLSFWSWYETEPQLLPQTIYFDVYHDTDGDDISGGIYTDWADALITDGYTVIEYNQPIDSATLSGHHVLALFDPEVAFSAAEITAINSFMQNGGRVVVLGEWGDLDGTNTVLNALTAGHGITLNSDTVQDSTDNDGQDYWPLISNFADDPLVRGVNAVVLYASSSLSLSGSAVPLATGDGDASAMASSGDTLEALEGSDENEVSLDQLVQPLDIIPGAPVVMAYTPVGTGELIAIGDSGLWHNEDPDGDGVIALDEYSNQQLSFRVFGKEVDHPLWDQKWVQISVDGGPFQNLLQVTGWPMEAWHQVNVDLSPYVGSQVRIRFYFDTIDSVMNAYRGWYIDDFLLDVATVPPPGPTVYDSHLIDDDNSGQSSGNDNGIVNPGETVEMFVELHNLGSTTANNVEACINENSPYVSGFLFNTCSNYGNIPGGGTVTNTDDFDYSVSSSAPAGHVIHFTLSVTADNGGPWTTSFDVAVGGPPPPPGPVVYFDYVIDDDDTGQSVGNGDGQINPGETIELYVDLLNAGLGTANALNACLSEGSPYVDCSLFNTCSNYGDLAGGGTALNTDDFDCAVDINAPYGHVIPFTVNATAANGGPWTSTFDVMVVGDSTRLYIEPPDQDAPLSGGPFVVDVMVDNVSDLGAFEFDLVYDPAIVHVDDVALGSFLGSTGRSVSEAGPNIDNVTGHTTYGAFSFGGGAGPSGGGVAATVTLSPQATGESNLVLENEQLTDTDGSVIPSITSDGHVTVTDIFFADVDGDDDVDIVDIQLVASRWGCVLGDSCYSSVYDMDNDGDVDVADIQIVACHWGWPSGDFSICYTPTTLGEEPSEGEGTSQALTVQVQPPVTTLGGAGEVFTITVYIANAENLGAFQFDLNYDPATVQVNNVTLGDFLGSTGRAVSEPGPDIDNTTGKVSYVTWTQGSSSGPDGSGTLVRIELGTRAEGSSVLDLANVTVADIGGREQSATVQDGQVRVGETPVYLPAVLKDH